ncbi:MAG TPA: amidohydrolase family protein [Acidimicrobiia bacterium]|nr:amidohydrolase family protein [Acidimicrobiia bacterium]
MSGTTLIAGGCVLTLDAKIGNFSVADVLIEAGKVVEVGTGLRARGAEVVDASEAIVMPGFVDSHRHAWQSLFRNSGDDSLVADYGAYYTPEDVYAASLGGLLAAVDAGITTVVDWFDLDPGPEFTEAALSAHAEAGSRSVFAVGGGDGDWRHDLSRLHQGWGDRPLTSLAAGVSGLPDFDVFEADWQFARDLGLRVHSHVRGAGSVADLGRHRLLSGAVTLVGCTDLGEDDFDAVKSTGAAVALTPAAGMAGGAGAPPVQQLIDRGIRPGLGVGSDSGSPGDIFAQMRAVISIQHATVFDRKLAGKAGLPTLLNTREVIRYATSDGARAAGLPPGLGTLAPGSPADVIVLRTDRPNIHPINDPIGAVVWGMDTSNVDWVFVDGRPLKQAGILEADVPAVRRDVEAAAARVAAAAGTLAGTGGATG